MPEILLLHGAAGSRQEMEPLAESLSGSGNLHCLNISGHGGEPITGEAFSIRSFAEKILDYLAANQLEQVVIVGYSMGGYVAMYLARHYPEKIKAVATLATKYHWDESIAAKEIKLLQPDMILEKVPAFAAALEQRHAPQDWKIIVQKTADMLWDMGNDNPLKPVDYQSIHQPVLLLLGDRDKMVPLYETIDVYQKLPDGRLCILPGTPHAIDKVDINQLAFMIRSFLQGL